MEYGIVYLLTNPVMPGLVKIGMTTREDMAPGKYWTYKDRSLDDIYDERYPFDE